MLKRKLRAITGDGGNGYNFASAQTVTSNHSASTASFRTNEDYHLPEGHQLPLRGGTFNQQHGHQPIPHNNAASSGAFSLSLVTPSKEARASPLLVHSPHQDSKRSPQMSLLQQSIQPPQVVRFEIDDQVDGMCVLANGSKRWFPGKIIAVDAPSNTYSLLFNDGDISTHKPAEEIRHTKRRTNSNASSTAPVEVTKPAAVKEVAVLPVLAVTMIHTHGDTHITPIKINTTLISQEIVSPGDFFALSPFSEYNGRSDSFKSAIDAQEAAEGAIIANNQQTAARGIAAEGVTPTGQVGMSIKSVQCDDDCDAEEDDDSSHGSEEDRVYEIPSVFEGKERAAPRVLKTREDIVPKMRFEDLNLSAALPQTYSGLSLSSTLVSNDQSFRGANVSGRQQNASHRSLDGASHFGHNLHSKSTLSNHHSTGKSSSRGGAVSERGDEYSGATRMLSWRGEEGSRALSERTSSRGFRPMAAPTDASLIASQEIVLKRRASLKGSRKNSSAYTAQSARKIQESTRSL